MNGRCTGCGHVEGNHSVNCKQGEIIKLRALYKRALTDVVKESRRADEAEARALEAERQRDDAVSRVEDLVDGIKAFIGSQSGGSLSKMAAYEYLKKVVSLPLPGSAERRNKEVMREMGDLFIEWVEGAYTEEESYTMANDSNGEKRVAFEAGFRAACREKGGEG